MPGLRQQLDQPPLVGPPVAAVGVEQRGDLGVGSRPADDVVDGRRPFEDPDRALDEQVDGRRGVGGGGEAFDPRLVEDRDRVGVAGDRGVEDGRADVSLRPEHVVDGLHGDAPGVGDGLDRGRQVPVLDEQPRRGVDDAGPGPHRPSTTTVGRRLCRDGRLLRGRRGARGHVTGHRP